MAAVFLTAHWRYLAMLNYRVPPDLLLPLVPKGTELDTWQGHAYVSVVGFLFEHTRVLGIPVPFHQTFEEVNLRFYVKREAKGETRRGVTFIRELVPRRSVAWLARFAYNEPYRAVPMRHAFGIMGPAWRPLSVEYAWKARGRWSGLRVAPTGNAHHVRPGSEEEFLSHHRWGYTRAPLGTIEYEVRHDPWPLWKVPVASLVGDLAPVYGERFAKALAGQPHCAYLAEGSAVTVHWPRRLPRRPR